MRARARARARRAGRGAPLPRSARARATLGPAGSHGSRAYDALCARAQRATACTALDDQGAKFDAHGRFTNWWTPDDLAHFEASGAALAAQFSAYRPFPDMAVDGKLTLSENIADLAELSGDQQFFLAFAQSWQSKIRDKTLRQLSRPTAMRRERDHTQLPVAPLSSYVTLSLRENQGEFAMSALTADDLYELAQRLPASERLRLVEKIAHHLTLKRDPEPPQSARPPVSGARIRTQLIGQVTDIAVDPLRFTIRTPRGEVSVSAELDLTENVWSAWGHEVIADVEAFLDLEGKTLDAMAISLELAAQAEDLLSTFESTFGSGSEIWSTTAARRELATMRGGRL